MFGNTPEDSKSLIFILQKRKDVINIMMVGFPFAQVVVVGCFKCQPGFEQRVNSRRILEEHIHKCKNKPNTFLSPR